MTEVFGEYELLSTVGRGGMGEVYRARKHGHNRIVALKRLPRELSEDRTFATRFRNECVTVAGLEHPHIVPVYDYGETDGRLFISMRLIDGHDLADEIEAGPVAVDRAVEIVSQIADALDFAHGQGFEHRDVKPQNIMVAANPSSSGGPVARTKVPLSSTKQPWPTRIQDNQPMTDRRQRHFVVLVRSAVDQHHKPRAEHLRYGPRTVRVSSLEACVRSVAFRVLLGVVGVVLLAACGSSAGSPKKTVTAVRTVVQTPTPTPASAADTDADVPSDDPSISGGAVPSVSGVVQPNRSGSPLTLDDFFQPGDSWSQEVVSVANQSGVSGVRGDINCGSDNLELRLNDQFHSLTFDSAEDNTSPSSSTTMVVSVTVNGQQVTAKQVKFNSVLKLTVNVASANAVVITYNGGDNNCAEVYPVLFNAVLT